MKVECGGICVLWTLVCPLYIVICLFCKSVVWDGNISFCDRKLASSYQVKYCAYVGKYIQSVSAEQLIEMVYILVSFCSSRRCHGVYVLLEML